MHTVKLSHPYVEWTLYPPRTSPVSVKVWRRTWVSKFFVVYKNFASHRGQLAEFCIQTWVCTRTRFNWLRKWKLVTINKVVCLLSKLRGVWKRTWTLAKISSETRQGERHDGLLYKRFEDIVISRWGDENWSSDLIWLDVFLCDENYHTC